MPEHLPKEGQILPEMVTSRKKQILPQIHLSYWCNRNYYNKNPCVPTQMDTSPPLISQHPQHSRFRLVELDFCLGAWGCNVLLGK